MKIDLFRQSEDIETFKAGVIIFSEGQEAGGVMYVVQEGQVDILMRGECIDTIGPGTCLGEIALIDQWPRSATAVAKTDCKLVPINERHFKFLVQQTPHFALQVMRTMAERLRRYRDY
ncbi:MAG: cyclic nucleotide-binding domain-containing protein [Acidimicrobiia bacterium]